MLSQVFQPLEAQLSLKAALPLAERFATTSYRCGNTGPSCKHAGKLRPWVTYFQTSCPLALPQNTQHSGSRLLLGVRSGSPSWIELQFCVEIRHAASCQQKVFPSTRNYVPETCIQTGLCPTLSYVAQFHSLKSGSYGTMTGSSGSTFFSGVCRCSWCIS